MRQLLMITLLLKFQSGVMCLYDDICTNQNKNTFHMHQLMAYASPLWRREQHRLWLLMPKLAPLLPSVAAPLSQQPAKRFNSKPMSFKIVTFKRSQSPSKDLNHLVSFSIGQVLTRLVHVHTLRQGLLPLHNLSHNNYEHFYEVQDEDFDENEDEDMTRTRTKILTRTMII